MLLAPVYKRLPLVAPYKLPARPSVVQLIYVKHLIAFDAVATLTKWQSSVSAAPVQCNRHRHRRSFLPFFLGIERRQRRLGVSLHPLRAALNLNSRLTLCRAVHFTLQLS